MSSRAKGGGGCQNNGNISKREGRREREREREREKEEEGKPPTGKQEGNSRETKQNYRRLDREAITCTCDS